MRNEESHEAWKLSSQLEFQPNELRNYEPFQNPLKGDGKV